MPLFKTIGDFRYASPMQNRRTFTLALFLAPLSLLISRGKTATAVEVGDLREQLRLKLRPRTPNEQQFLDRVVVLVEEGTLPRYVVLQLFQWARKKQPYPFPYFQRALTLRARTLGVVI